MHWHGLSKLANRKNQTWPISPMTLPVITRVSFKATSKTSRCLNCSLSHQLDRTREIYLVILLSSKEAVSSLEVKTKRRIQMQSPLILIRIQKTACCPCRPKISTWARKWIASMAKISTLLVAMSKTIEEKARKLHKRRRRNSFKQRNRSKNHKFRQKDSLKQRN